MKDIYMQLLLWLDDDFDDDLLLDAINCLVDVWFTILILFSIQGNIYSVFIKIKNYIKEIWLIICVFLVILTILKLLDWSLYYFDYRKMILE